MSNVSNIYDDRHGSSYEFASATTAAAGVDTAAATEYDDRQQQPQPINGYHSDGDANGVPPDGGDGADLSSPYDRRSAARSPVRGNSPRRQSSISPQRARHSASPQSRGSQQRHNSRSPVRASQEPEYATVDRYDDVEEMVAEAESEPRTPVSTRTNRTYSI